MYLPVSSNVLLSPCSFLPSRSVPGKYACGLWAYRLHQGKGNSLVGASEGCCLPRLGRQWDPCGEPVFLSRPHFCLSAGMMPPPMGMMPPRRRSQWAASPPSLVPFPHGSSSSSSFPHPLRPAAVWLPAGPCTWQQVSGAWGWWGWGGIGRVGLRPRPSQLWVVRQTPWDETLVSAVGAQKGPCGPWGLGRRADVWRGCVWRGLWGWRGARHRRLGAACWPHALGPGLGRVASSGEGCDWGLRDCRDGTGE